MAIKVFELNTKRSMGKMEIQVKGIIRVLGKKTTTTGKTDQF